MKNKSDNPGAGEGRSGLSRREFLAGTGGAALSFSIMKPELARGSQVSSKISSGLDWLRQPWHVDRRPFPKAWRIRDHRRP